jgi:hypothetical protein
MMAIDVLVRYGDLRRLERYRDSLWPGAAEREGAEEMVRLARHELDRRLAELSETPPVVGGSPGPAVGRDAAPLEDWS